MEWIKCNERMPERMEEVLVLVDGHRSPAWCNSYMLVAYLSNSDDFFEERHRDPLVGVTHWMPLPERPKETW